MDGPKIGRCKCPFRFLLSNVILSFLFSFWILEMEKPRAYGPRNNYVARWVDNNSWICFRWVEYFLVFYLNFNGMFALFQNLYCIIDDQYQYDGKMPLETELPNLFKPLGYPYLPNASILKSFNSPHYWPQILAALSWLREIVQVSSYISKTFSFFKVLFSRF